MGFASGSVEDHRSRALAAAKRAVELDPSSYDAYVALGLAHREMAQIEPWRAAARKAIAMNPLFSEGYALLGDSYAETPAWGCGRDRDSSRAISFYRQALRIDPTVTWYHVNLTNYLRYDGRIEEALQAAEEGLRLFRTSRGIRRMNAYVLIELGRIDEAERMLREAVSDGGPRFEDELNLAIIDLKRGRLEAAGEALRRLGPTGGSVWGLPFYIAHHYLAAGLVQPAIEHLEGSVRGEPACAQWLLTTQSSYWASIRANPEGRALLERYARR